MSDTKAQIIYNDGTFRYFDKNGKELHEGDVIRYSSGEEEVLYRTDQGCLGTDATNPTWIKNGWADPCEFGIYPLEMSDLEDCEIKQ